jgi:hypothetical protein
MNNVPEIRLALFGPSGSGKTTLLASYFGNQQRNSFEETHGYRLEADDVSQGNQLLARYYRMEEGEFPLGTEQFFEYRFGFKVLGLPEPAFHVVWYDYPGGWWERTPKDDSEKAARRDALAKLLLSHVGILLVDGMKYKSEGLPYVRHLLDLFRNEVRRISDEFAACGTPLEQEWFPKQWIIAISKADLLPADVTAEKVCRDIVSRATDQLGGVAKAVNSKSFGRQYLLLSSVRGDSSHVIDAHDFIGLQLIAPITLLSVLSELAEKANKDSGSGFLKTIFGGLSALLDLIDKLDDFLPPKYQPLSRLLKALEIKDGIDKRAEYYRQQQYAAAKKGDALKAAVNALRAELASPAAQRAFYRNQS